MDYEKLVSLAKEIKKNAAVSEVRFFGSRATGKRHIDDNPPLETSDWDLGIVIRQKLNVGVIKNALAATNTDPLTEKVDIKMVWEDEIWEQHFGDIMKRNNSVLDGLANGIRL